jgi:hypothetical protein
VGIDRSDDADQPPAEHPDSSAARPDTPANGADQRPAEHPDSSAARPDTPANDARQSRRDQIEPRSHEEYYTALRAADLRAATESDDRTEPAGRSEPGARAKSPEPTESGQQAKQGSTWEDKAEESRWIWGEYQRHFPSEERPAPDTSKDPAGSWRADADRYLDPSKNRRIEAECDRIADREEKEITPALRAIESQDPNRHLVGLEHVRKGRDRIKEKVYDDIEFLGRSPSEAISLLPDAIRYTFQYDESRYTHGVLADIERMRGQGFKLEKLRNYWSDDQYRGINSQWIEPRTGQRFELQFHTHISFEAKEITHPAYERLRTHQADAFEEMVLEAFQRKVTDEIPIPLGVSEIPDYPERERDAG